jgi:hypothetical protein
MENTEKIRLKINLKSTLLMIKQEIYSKNIMKNTVKKHGVE